MKCCRALHAEGCVRRRDKMRINSRLRVDYIILIFLVYFIMPSEAAHEECPSWSYFGLNGPSHWQELCDYFIECGTGLHQSPINIDLDRIVVDPTLGPVVFDYMDMAELNASQDDDTEGTRRRRSRFNSAGNDETPLATTSTALVSRDIIKRHGVNELFENNGHTIEMVWRPKGDFISGGPLEEGKQFHLAQFHFHSPSENFFHGLEHPLEVHMVHAAADGTLAVVAVFFEESDVSHDDFLRTLATNIPDPHHESFVEAPDLKKLVLDSFRDGYYYFEGSLTTPPCTEGVHWIVARRVLPATYDELQVFRFSLIDNHRPKQHLNDRVIRQFVPYETRHINVLHFLIASILGVAWLVASIATVLYCKLYKKMN